METNFIICITSVDSYGKKIIDLESHVNISKNVFQCMKEIYSINNDIFNITYFLREDNKSVRSFKYYSCV